MPTFGRNSDKSRLKWRLEIICYNTAAVVVTNEYLTKLIIKSSEDKFDVAINFINTDPNGTQFTIMFPVHAIFTVRDDV